MDELYHQLLLDIEAIGLYVPFDLSLKPYSKTFFGRYNPNNNRITVYVYQDRKHRKPYPYGELLLTAIHEVIHAMQWNDPDFVRKQGIMHDYEFHELYRKYSDRAKALLRLREVRNDKSYSISV